MITIINNKETKETGKDILKLEQCMEKISMSFNHAYHSLEFSPNKFQIFEKSLNHLMELFVVNNVIVSWCIINKKHYANFKELDIYINSSVDDLQNKISNTLNDYLPEQWNMIKEHADDHWYLKEQYSFNYNICHWLKNSTFVDIDGLEKHTKSNRSELKVI